MIEPFHAANAEGLLPGADSLCSISPRPRIGEPCTASAARDFGGEVAGAAWLPITGYSGWFLVYWKWRALSNREAKLESAPKRRARETRIHCCPFENLSKTPSEPSMCSPTRSSSVLCSPICDCPHCFVLPQDSYGGFNPLFQKRRTIGALSGHLRVEIEVRV